MAFASFSAANTVIQGHPKKTLELPISRVLPLEILKSRVSEMPFPAFGGEIL